MGREGDFDGTEERPSFAFVGGNGALQVAKQMYQIAALAEQAQTNRNGKRDEALAGWKGVFGDDFRERAADVDKSFENAAATIRYDAREWSKAWLNMVNNMNRYTYGRAYDEQKSYLEQKIEDSFPKPWLDNAIALGVGGATGLAVKKGVDYFGEGNDNTLDGVPKPPEWGQLELPQPPEFVAFFSPFVYYTRDGDQMKLNYCEYAPRYEA